MSDKIVPGPRLAYRVEGNMWNVYMARPDTMEGATLIASIAMRLIEGNPERKRVFMELIKEAFGEMIQLVTGGPVVRWDEQSAPESERAGHG